VDEVLFKNSESIKDLTEMAFDPSTKVEFQSLMEMAPRVVDYKNRKFKLEYLPIKKEGKLTGIFVSGLDITEETKLKHQMEEENKQNKMFIGLIKNRPIFQAFFG